MRKKPQLYQNTGEKITNTSTSAAGVTNKKNARDKNAQRIAAGIVQENNRRNGI